MEKIRKYIFKQKEIAERQIKTMKQGIWSKKDFVFNRNEVYTENSKDFKIPSLNVVNPFCEK
jgi:hypothetical protein